MATQIRLKKVLTLNGLKRNIGEVIEIPEASAKGLIANGKAEAVEIVQEAVNSDGDQKVDDNGEGGTGEENGGNAGGSDDKTPEELAAEAAEAHAKLVKAIDEKNKRDELYEAAKALDIEIAHDIKKAELIEKIIENGKYDHLV